MIFRSNYCRYTVFATCCHQKRKLNPIAENFIEHETVAINEKKISNNSDKLYFHEIPFLESVN